MKEKKENSGNSEMDNKINIERKNKKESDEQMAKKDDSGVKEENIRPEETIIPPVSEKEYISLKEENEKYQKEITELKDRLLRKAAEFENYKRRTENEQLNLLKYAAENFIVKVLPVYDDLERSLTHIKDGENNESFREGLQLVYNKFQKVMEEQGVKKIDSVGKPFDVNFHEALLQRTVEGVDPHTVVDEVEPGYMYKDKVIRHSKVIVSDENSTSKQK